MKKLFLGLLIVGSLTACSNAKEMDQINTTNQKVSSVTTQVTELQQKVLDQQKQYEALKTQNMELQNKINALKESMSQIKK